MKEKSKKRMKDAGIIITACLAFIGVIALLNIYADYHNKNLAAYEFTVIDRWQDMHGGILRGSSTAYNIKVRVEKVKKEGKWVAEQPFEAVQTRRVSYGFYSTHKVGCEWRGESPHLFMYDR